MPVWFNPYNENHCKAYRHLQKTGHWPEGFELHDVEYDGAHWQVNLMARMTRAWIDYILDSEKIITGENDHNIEESKS